MTTQEHKASLRAHNSVVSYLKVFLLTILAGIALTATINYVVNPFDIYQSISISHFNRDKTQLKNRERLWKPYIERKIKPEVIILGNSRSERGLDPEHPALLKISKKVYNLSAPGLSMYEALKLLQISAYNGKINTVILGIDLMNFTRSQIRDSRLDQRLAINSNFTKYIGYSIDDILESLLSIHALIASYKTVIQQNEYLKITHKPNGLAMFNEGDKIIRIRGHFNYFLEKDQLYAQVRLNHGANTFNNPFSESPALEYFRLFVDSCYKSDINLYIFIQPVHAHIQEIFRLKGIWPIYRTFEKQLVKIVANESHLHKKPPFPLWDFSGYNSVTTEDIPQEGDLITHMRWWWGGAHYKKKLGNLILDRIFHYHDLRNTIPDDFGFLITEDNFEQDLNKIRTEQERYHQTHVVEVEKPRRLVLGK
jgi:hypothetical protein